MAGFPQTRIFGTARNSLLAESRPLIPRSASARWIQVLMAEIQCYLDEHMDTAIAVGSRQRGIDVKTTVESGLMTADDSQQLAFTSSEQRVFVTRDRGILAHLLGVSHAGIVIAKSGRGTIGLTVLALSRLRRMTTAEEMFNRVDYLQ